MYPESDEGIKHMELTIEVGKRTDYDQKESTHGPEAHEVHATNNGNAHQEKDNFTDYKEDPMKYWST
ncbi:unnamed protein product [Dovyalis caffra]|uniref:Uncharacterized protein n=1 Tax=Dovyalis caffra TaxID=77055 RepID=A0AAV1SP56_9ROSI|nr:unnamed protein product [Dovyalis caffra]